MNQSKNFSRFRLVLIFLSLAVAYAAPNYAHYQLSALTNDLYAMFPGISTSQYNLLFTAPMMVPVFLGLFSGMLVDKNGPKYVIGLSLVLSVIGGWLRCAAASYGAMFLSMILLGVSTGIITSNVAKIIASVFPVEKTAQLTGFIIAVSTGVMMLSMATTALMSKNTAFVLAAVLVTAGLVLWFVFVPNIRQVGESGEKISMKEALHAALRCKNVWIAGIAAFCIGGAMTGTGSSTAAALISTGVSAEAAGVVSSMLMLGNMLSCLITPTIAAKTGKYRMIIAVTGIIALFCVSFGWRIPYGPLLYAVMLLTGFCLGSSLTLLLSMAVRFDGIGPKYAGTAGSLVAVLQIIGCISLPSFIAGPIAGENYSVYFLVLGLFALLWIAGGIVLPKSLDVKS